MRLILLLLLTVEYLIQVFLLVCSLTILAYQWGCMWLCWMRHLLQHRWLKLLAVKSQDLKYQNCCTHFKMPVLSIINDDFCRALASVAHNAKGDKGWLWRLLWGVQFLCPTFLPSRPPLRFQRPPFWKTLPSIRQKYFNLIGHIFFNYVWEKTFHVLHISKL